MWLDACCDSISMKNRIRDAFYQHSLISNCLRIKTTKPTVQFGRFKSNYLLLRIFVYPNEIIRSAKNRAPTTTGWCATICSRCYVAQSTWKQREKITIIFSKYNLHACSSRDILFLICSGMFLRWNSDDDDKCCNRQSTVMVIYIVQCLFCLAIFYVPYASFFISRSTCKRKVSRKNRKSYKKRACIHLRKRSASEIETGVLFQAAQSIESFALQHIIWTFSGWL